MDISFVLQVVPNADPNFLRVTRAIAVPNNLLEQMRAILPALHALFLEKRDAFQRGAWKEFARVLERETQLLEQSIEN